MKDINDMLFKWRKRARQSQQAHFDSSAFCTFWHFMLGAVVVTMATIAGSAPITKFLGSNEIAILTVAVAVLAALQTFLRLPERAEKHRVVGAGLSALKKKIEKLQVFGSDDMEREIESLMLDWNNIIKDAPTAVRIAWKRTIKTEKGEGDERIA